MRARLASRPARASLAGLAAAIALLSAAGARADDPAALRGEVERLRERNAGLAARSDEALLELYALESRLGRAERRLVALRERAAAIDREQASERAQLAAARASLVVAERELAERLRALYIEGEPDPLAVLLGAASLDEAVTALDSLDRLVRQDRDIVAQVSRTRAALHSTLAGLRQREIELADVLDQARGARDRLAAARAGREAYLAALARESRLNAARIARLTARAAAIGAKADAITDAAVAAAPAGGESLLPVAPVAADAPAGPGQTLIVVATGYALPGTTATGLPVQWGVVAVDPAVIPLGTSLFVPGYGEGIAADTGSAVRGAVIDLWFPTLEQALAWGRRTVTITLD